MIRALVLAAVAWWPAIAAAIDVPYLTGRVVDNAEILSPGARAHISEVLKQHEDSTSNQIAVLTVPSLEGESIEEFALRVFEEWKLGRKGKDNGVLIVVAPQDRRIRIEVGYGLEGTLTDVAASRIIRNVMTPRFKNNDFDGGVRDGADAVVAVLNGGDVPAGLMGEASETTSQGGTNDDFMKGPDMPWPQRILIGAFIFGIIGLFTVIGAATPGGTGWFLYLFLIPFWAMFPIMVVGGRITLYIFGCYLVGYPLVKLLLRQTDWYRKAATSLAKTGSASIGGFSVSSGGGSSSSSSSSGGGFSGGGGRSGGGGASGSW